MRPRTEYNDARRMLVRLLHQDDDGPIVGVEDFKDSEREFMKITCAHVVIMYHLCYMSGFEETEAKKGWDALVVATDKMLKEICTL